MRVVERTRYRRHAGSKKFLGAGYSSREAGEGVAFAPQAFSHRLAYIARCPRHGIRHRAIPGRKSAPRFYNRGADPGPVRSVQIEQQHLGVVAVIDDNFGFALDLQRVA